MTRDPFIVAINGNPAEIAASAETLSMMLSYAESAFGLLARVHSDHAHLGHLGFEAISVLCERALSSVGANEGLVVERLVADLRNSARGGPSQ